jgi:hypothetical protein
MPSLSAEVALPLPAEAISRGLRNYFNRVPLMKVVQHNRLSLLALDKGTTVLNAFKLLSKQLAPAAAVIDRASHVYQGCITCSQLNQALDAELKAWPGANHTAGSGAAVHHYDYEKFLAVGEALALTKVAMLSQSTHQGSVSKTAACDALLPLFAAGAALVPVLGWDGTLAAAVGSASLLSLLQQDLSHVDESAASLQCVLSLPLSDPRITAALDSFGANVNSGHCLREGSKATRAITLLAEDPGACG